MNVASRPQYGPLSSPSKSSISFAHRSVTKLDFINFSWTFSVVKSKGLRPIFLLASLKMILICSNGNSHQVLTWRRWKYSHFRIVFVSISNFATCRKWNFRFQVLLLHTNFDYTMLCSVTEICTSRKSFFFYIWCILSSPSVFHILETPILVFLYRSLHLF